MGIFAYIKDKITGYETRRTDKALVESLKKTYSIERSLDSVIGELESKFSEHEAMMQKAYSENLVQEAYLYATKMAECDAEKKCLIEQKNRIDLSRALLKDEVTLKSGYKKAKALLDALENIEEGLTLYKAEFNTEHKEINIEDVKKWRACALEGVVSR
jgi:hypothetical protein